MGSFLDLYASAAHDHPARPFGEFAPACYVIASSPRTGSTLLADGLRASGGLGVALEYLDLAHLAPRLTARWGVVTGDVGHYLLGLHQHRTTPEGWLGVKTHWYQLRRFLNAVNGRPDDERVDPGTGRAALELLLGTVHWIRLRRQDTVAQAVSWYRSGRTGSTVRMAGNAPVPAPDPVEEVDVAELERYHRRVVHQDRTWDEALYDAERVTDVTYEELDRDLGGTVAHVRERLGLGSGATPEPTIEKQRDAWSDAAGDLLRARLQRAAEVSA